MKPNLTRIYCIALFVLAVRCSAQDPTAPNSKPEPTGQNAPATTANAKTPPPGVSAKSWVQITDTFGFVITKERADGSTIVRVDGKDIQTPPFRSVATGYFMIFHEGRWFRTEAELPTARVFPAR